jgi:hypothetical protein
MREKSAGTISGLTDQFIRIISETNGIALTDTLELMIHSPHLKGKPHIERLLCEFMKLLSSFQIDEVDIDTLLNHPVSEALFNFLKEFPLKYHEEHIHLTGSLSADFIYPRLKKLLEGPHKEDYEQRIKNVYGEDAIPIESEEHVAELIQLSEGEQFKTYLKILFLAKLVLVDKKAHFDAAYHMAQALYHQYNVGFIRLKFTLSRATNNESEKIPGIDHLNEEDVVLSLYDGFKTFQSEHPDFNFVLSPSFRKENDFFDNKNFSSKKEHFNQQVESLLSLVEKHPKLRPHLCEVDTVGDEKELYRKKHFDEMKPGLRRLQYNGFKVRSHHGETWKILRKGIQSVDNSMNIWHINTLEHGLSLGINPNFYFHRLYQRVMKMNHNNGPIDPDSSEGRELMDMDWNDKKVRDKLFRGETLAPDEEKSFIKTKFHTAREIEHYQHDILNRMINKNVSLVALPSSNLKLTGAFPDYKDHPFSWWEKKGVKLGVGTDNYITLNTNYIQEMLILLYSDPQNLKITKLLMVTTKEERRPFISHLLWAMRKQIS